MSEKYHNVPSHQLLAVNERLQDWLREKALPLWMENGVDRETGEFVDSLCQQSGKDSGAPRRGRTQPRQIFSCIAAQELGWFADDMKALACKGLSYLEKHHKLADGTYAFTLMPRAKSIDPQFGLYKQVFVFLALASVSRVMPEHKAELEARAFALLKVLNERFRHPEAGFEEAEQRELPLCANPHMHLFEATLEWERASDDPVWKTLSDELGELALRHFIDARTGALREFFDGDWKPMPDDSGRIVEPGHQFEWTWLLADWGQRRKRADALQAARRLFWIGETYGLCDICDAAIDQLDDTFNRLDDTTHLWPQTEWIKGAVALASLSTGSERNAYLQSALRACLTLEGYLKTPVDGMWHNRRYANGEYSDDPAIAGLLYHIILALRELNDFVKTLRSRVDFI